MNREQIIRMAREAGFGEHETPHVKIELLERFAALVAAAEREACAKVCDAVYEGRAKIGQRQGYNAIMQCQEAIRARGKA